MESYDFFISYKWDTYSKEAKALYDIAVSRHFRAWLDICHPFQAPEGEAYASDEALARHLRTAMNSCRYVLFFETTATMAMTAEGESVRVLSWQEHELDMADANKLIVLYHGASPRTICFGTSPDLHKYRELNEAFTLIESAVADTSHELWS